MAMSFEVLHNTVNINATVDYQFSITYGRQDPTQSCAPANASIRIIYAGSSLDPSDFQLGDTINIRQLNTGQPTISMFQGTITNMSADHETIRMQCVSKWLGSLARTFIDMPAYTNTNLQTVGQAALTAAVAAGAPIGASWNVDPKLYNVTVPAATQVSALTYLQSLETSEPNGVVREYPAGFVSFAGYDQRRVSTMAASQKFLWSSKTSFGYDWTLEKNSADFRNQASVTYVDGTAFYVDTASVTAHGQFATSTSTYLTNSTDATYIATRNVQSGLEPDWRTTGLRIRFDGFTDLERYTICDEMRTGSYLETPVLSPAVGNQFFVEGWTDDCAYNAATGIRQWVRTLFISDITASQSAQRYQDVTSGVTYATVNPTYRWVDLEQNTI